MVTRINIGPVHPSTHGVLRLVVDLEGDTIKNVEPHIGFLHRGVEKLCETRMYMQNPPYMEKLDYIAPMSFNELYVATVEKAMNIAVKERAQYIRVILLELQRIASHLLWLTTLGNDLGQLFTIFMWAFIDRDKVLNLLEEATGQRMFYMNMRLGGMHRDLPADFAEHTVQVLDYLEGRIRDYEELLEKNPVFLERTKGVGALSAKRARELGVTGPVLRASGVEYDTRKNKPYYVYDKLRFSPQVLHHGDCFDRYKVRMMEMKESSRLVRLALQRMPEGDALGAPVKLISPNASTNVVTVSRETPRGEGMMYMVPEAQRPYRLSIRSPTFINLSAVNELARGHRLADLFAITSTLDPVMADSDR